VVVLAPLLRGFGAGVARQVEKLRASSRVELVSPDAETLKAIGRNVLDPARRADAARAGLAQSASVIDRVRSVWT
jgi:NTE family protein